MAAALILSGCGGLIGSKPDPAPEIKPAPSLLQPCAQPVTIPEKDLTDQEIEVMWGRDRRALRVCADRHSGISGYFAE